VEAAGALRDPERLAALRGTVKSRMRLGIEKLRTAWARRDAAESHRALIAA
jgi:hypothetical protein